MVRKLIKAVTDELSQPIETQASFIRSDAPRETNDASAASQ